MKIEVFYYDYHCEKELLGKRNQDYVPMKIPLFINTFNIYAYADEWHKLIKCLKEGMGCSYISMTNDSIYDWLDTTMWTHIDIHIR